jgi:exodeoxyribonuclease-3
LPSQHDPALQVTAITLNIGAAAPWRANGILAWLLEHGDDIIVLTETTAGLGTQLLVKGLADHGYETVGTPTVNDRGAVIATRLPIGRRLCASLDVTLPWRVAAIQLVGPPSIAFLGVYIPSRDRTPEKVARKEAFIGSFVTSIERLSPTTRDRMIVAGDYNAISRRHEPPHGGFLDYEYQLFESLEAFGFTAGHELGLGHTHPHSWIGRTGRGYLYDYFHIGRSVRAHVDECVYVHETRQSRLSDHAAVRVALRIGRRGQTLGD